MRDTTAIALTILQLQIISSPENLTMAKLIFIFMLLCTVAFSDQPYQRVIHSTDPEALCLDGTPPVLYYHNGAIQNKFLIFFIGGGLCNGTSLEQTTADCYARSKTQLGSSKFWPEQLQGEGYLSTNPAESDFANWTKIVLGYCDGSFHQGYRKNPISYRGDKLYFRGSLITKSHFTWIANKYPSFKNADQVIVTGSSAGGVATYIWANYVRTLVANASNVLSIPDSGIFLPYKTYDTQYNLLETTVVNLFKLANIDEKTPLQLCNLRYKDEEWKCLFINYAFTSFQSKTMLVGSEYDSWVINNALKIKCLKKGNTEYTLSGCSENEINYIEGYRKKFQDFMGLYTMNSKNSVWSIGCSQHGYSFTNKYYNSQTEKVPDKTGMTIKQAINAFVFDQQKVVLMESKPWPSNTGCAY